MRHGYYSSVVSLPRGPASQTRRPVSDDVSGKTRGRSPVLRTGALAGRTALAGRRELSHPNPVPTARDHPDLPWERMFDTVRCVRSSPSADNNVSTGVPSIHGPWRRTQRCLLVQRARWTATLHVTRKALRHL